MSATTTDTRGRIWRFGRWYPSSAVSKSADRLGDAFADCRRRVEKELARLSAGELTALVEAVEKGDFSTTNCWWATYEVIHAFKSLIVDEPRRREVVGTRDA